MLPANLVTSANTESVSLKSALQVTTVLLRLTIRYTRVNNTPVMLVHTTHGLRRSTNTTVSIATLVITVTLLQLQTLLDLIALLVTTAQ